MKHFACPKCSNTVYFENVQCESCGSYIGYEFATEKFVLVENTLQENYHYCINYNNAVCNWVLEASSSSSFCKACELNRKVPNPTDVENFEKWQKLEIAKHRLVYQLKKLGLPLKPKIENERGLAFDFLSENNDENVKTGHADGVVTIILSEADSVHREQLRMQMDEPYRTLLGHFRHEIGHYYWPLLFEGKYLNTFRKLFGDEQLNYSDALQNHYKNGAPGNWQLNFISKYASSHPWEDWAETWAHYLHIMDTLETANNLKISFQNSKRERNINCPDPYNTKNFKRIFDSGMELTRAANSLNRSMGLSDIYPFIVPQPVYQKLEFIHKLLKKANLFLN